MSNAYGVISKPVSIRGDLSYVLGTNSGDLETNCKASSINPMAKFKSVRSSKVGELSVSDRAATRYGFGTPIPTLNLSQNLPSGVWSYLKPRGAATYNEWYRDLDFDGYDHRACAPLCIYVGQLVYDGSSQIIVMVDDKTNALRTDGKTWAAGHSLSLAELLASNSSYYAYYISFLLIDNSDYSKNLIVTKITASALVSTYYGMATIELRDYNHEDASHPGVPLLAAGRQGDTFTIIGCLMAGNNPSGGAEYAVYSSSLTLYTPYSMGFVSGCDRITAVLGSGAFNMDGVQITSMNIVGVDTAREMTVNNLVWRAYAISVYVVISTANVAYSGRTMNISGSLQLSNSQGYAFGPGPTDGDNPISMPVAATNLVGGTAGQQRLIYTTGDSRYLWLLKLNGSLVSTNVTANVTFNYPFNVPISDSTTQVMPS